jgi:hypothetical protein
LSHKILAAFGPMLDGDPAETVVNATGLAETLITLMKDANTANKKGKVKTDVISFAKKNK